MTPPVKFSERCSIWPEHEISAINTARIAYKSSDQIRELVKKLQQQRIMPV
jgi:prophage regulatory protein